MRIRLIEFDGTAEEFDSSERVGEFLMRYGQPADAPGNSTVPAEAVEADDATAQEADDLEGRSTPSSPDAIPGVAKEGQDIVRRLLNRNPAGELFLRFLAETTSWSAVHVHGIRRKGWRSGDPLDYSRYLRIRKQGSNFGGFAYVYAIDGTVNLRLNYSTDEELHAIAPSAWRLHTGHRAYRVNIQITDEHTLAQALELARLAYDAT